MYINKLN